MAHDEARRAGATLDNCRVAWCRVRGRVHTGGEACAEWRSLRRGRALETVRTVEVRGEHIVAEVGYRVSYDGVDVVRPVLGVVELDQ